MDEDEESGGRRVIWLDAGWSGSTVGRFGVIPRQTTVSEQSISPARDETAAPMESGITFSAAWPGSFLYDLQRKT